MLIKVTSINGRMETGGVGEPLFDHCSLRSNLCRNNTRKTDDGRTLYAKTQTVKSVHLDFHMASMDSENQFTGFQQSSPMDFVTSLEVEGQIHKQ